MTPAERKSRISALLEEYAQLRAGDMNDDSESELHLDPRDPHAGQKAARAMRLGIAEEEERKQVPEPELISNLPDAETTLDRAMAAVHSWTHPGGLPWTSFWSHLVLATTPSGWLSEIDDPDTIAAGYTGRDLRRGYSAFMRLYFDTRFEYAKEGPFGIDTAAAKSLGASVVTAIRENDGKFFEAFANATAKWHKCKASGDPLLGPVHHIRYIVLCTLLEYPLPKYSPADLFQKIRELYPEEIIISRLNRHKVDIAVTDLGISRR